MSGKYVASVSLGKDSLAMILYILENGLPLDEVLFYDTGMEFSAIYRNRDRLAIILEQRGIVFTELKPKNAFLYDMLERPVTSKKKGTTTDMAGAAVNAAGEQSGKSRPLTLMQKMLWSTMLG